MFRDLRLLADAAGVDAAPLERRLRRRVDRVVQRARGLPRKRVFCLEWFEPLFCSGHWVPEMVEMAGGRDSLSRRKRDSARIDWEQLVDYAPDVLVLMPCGFTPRRARREIPVLRRRPEWKRIPAVARGEVWLVDAPSYFNGAGPRLVDGLEILAGIFHPGRFPRRRRRGVARVRG